MELEKADQFGDIRIYVIMITETDCESENTYAILDIGMNAYTTEKEAQEYLDLKTKGYVAEYRDAYYVQAICVKSMADYKGSR